MQSITEILARLADKLGDQEAGATTGAANRKGGSERQATHTQQPLTVDADNAGKILGVTPRTARRLLRTLVEEGLAWPLPLSWTPQPGRPRQLYRLSIEKLNDDATT